MDAQLELLAAKGQNVVAILGNVQEGEFELLPLDSANIAEFQTRNPDASFIGAIGMLDGHVRAALEAEIGPNTARAIRREYAAHVARMRCNA